MNTTGHVGLSHRDNNFDAIRFGLATLVIVSHAWVLPVGGPQGDPLYRLTRGQLDLGALAVNGFFVISGFLITMSWQNSRGATDYLRKRVLRIYPGFVVASILCMLVIAPLAGSHRADVLGVREIVRAAGRAVMLVEPKAHNAFPHNPMPGINHALWTVRYEFLCYLLLMALGLTGALARRGVVLALFFAALALHARQGAYIVFDTTVTDSMAPLGHLNDWPRFLSYFLGGAVAYLYREVMPRTLWLMALATLSIVGAAIVGKLFIALPIAGSYLLLCLAFSRSVRCYQFARYGDFSYGLYLWGFPLQQLAVHWFGVRVSPWITLACVFPLVLLLAVLSWNLVEVPFLRKKTAKPEAEKTVISLPPVQTVSVLPA